MSATSANGGGGCVPRRNAVRNSRPLTAVATSVATTPLRAAGFASMPLMPALRFRCSTAYADIALQVGELVAQSRQHAVEDGVERWCIALAQQLFEVDLRARPRRLGLGKGLPPGL